MEHISSYMGLEKEICDEIKAWSQYALETPNEEPGKIKKWAFLLSIALVTSLCIR